MEEKLEKESIREASKEVSKEFKTLTNEQHLDSLNQLQHLILGRLQDSNAVSHFNEYSENCFFEVSAEFSRNTLLLKSIKSDLDYIFLKLRSMKARFWQPIQMHFQMDRQRNYLTGDQTLEHLDDLR